MSELRREVRVSEDGALPEIYCFINGGYVNGDVTAVALTEDGRVINSHTSSSEDFSKLDLGLLHADYGHDFYHKHYPQGFVLIWCKLEDPRVMRAFEKREALIREMSEMMMTPPSKNGLQDLIESLTIFAKYQDPTHAPTICEHDVLIIVGIEKGSVTAGDAARLKVLGWFWSSEYDNWASFRFGSA